MCGHCWCGTGVGHEKPTHIRHCRMANIRTHDRDVVRSAVRLGYRRRAAHIREGYCAHPSETLRAVPSSRLDRSHAADYIRAGTSICTGDQVAHIAAGQTRRHATLAHRKEYRTSTIQERCLTQ